MYDYIWVEKIQTRILPKLHKSISCRLFLSQHTIICGHVITHNIMYIAEEQVVDELIHTKGEPNGLYPPYCCNKCGACDRRTPLLARCECRDLLLKCHSSCRNCVRAPQLIYPPRYQCLDGNFVSYLTCGKKCGGTASKSIIN